MTELDAVRNRLASARGEHYWRTLEEVADSAAFQELLAREMPAAASLWLDPMRRRSFLRLMAAALALGGLGSCGERPSEPIVPYVRAPEGIVPGRPLYFATAMASWGGLGLGLLVESHLGRPIKVEGNPRHPASLGATDAYAQASVLTLASSPRPSPRPPSARSSAPSSISIRKRAGTSGSPPGPTRSVPGRSPPSATTCDRFTAWPTRTSSWRSTRTSSAAGPRTSRTYANSRPAGGPDRR
ncbi:MAG: hypothetical protein E6J69_19800 [Deltaproteobacteria bacterium]|nr:MAG: hypothetical protein E6J69_19800 [Deltaproteobacteria bacterium]